MRIITGHAKESYIKKNKCDPYLLVFTEMLGAETAVKVRQAKLMLRSTDCFYAPLMGTVCTFYCPRLCPLCDFRAWSDTRFYTSCINSDVGHVEGAWAVGGHVGGETVSQENVLLVPRLGKRAAAQCHRSDALDLENLLNPVATLVRELVRCSAVRCRTI